MSQLMWIILITICGLACGIVNCRAQVWPHEDAIEGSSAVPGLFNKLGRTNPVWGLEAGGFQLGIQTSKDVYGTNEPVHALVTLTNLSLSQGWARQVWERGGMVSLELVLLHNREMVKSRYECDRSPVYYGRSSGRGRILQPGSKFMEGVRIDIQFHLEPNKLYHLYAYRDAAVGTNFTTVTSGNVSFMITNNVPAAGTASASAHVPHVLVSATSAVQTSGSLTPTKKEPVGRQEVPTVATKSTKQAWATAASASTDPKTPPAAAGIFGSSIGLVGWLLLGVPLAVLLWILGRAASRTRQTTKVQ